MSPPWISLYFRLVWGTVNKPSLLVCSEATTITRRKHPRWPTIYRGRRESLPSPEATKRLKRAQFCLPICWVCCKDPDNAGPCHLGPSPSCVPEVCAHRGGGWPPIQSSIVVGPSPTSATLEDLARDVPTGEVLQEPSAGVPPDMNKAMNALCWFVGEEPPTCFPCSAACTRSF